MAIKAYRFDITQPTITHFYEWQTLVHHRKKTLVVHCLHLHISSIEFAASVMVAHAHWIRNENKPNVSLQGIQPIILRTDEQVIRELLNTNRNLRNFSFVDLMRFDGLGRRTNRRTICLVWSGIVGPWFRWWASHLFSSYH